MPDQCEWCKGQRFTHEVWLSSKAISLKLTKAPLDLVFPINFLIDPQYRDGTQY